MLGGVADARFLSSTEMVNLAGMSYRQLDYWTRVGTLVPAVAAHGSGSVRGWAMQQVAIGRALVLLSDLGVRTTGLHALVAAVADDPGLAGCRVVLCALPGGGWAVRAAEETDCLVGATVNLAACRAYVCARRWPSAPVVAL